ncbi:AraC family transcriptional regulator [Sinomicrobium soli]|uniref:AraC family transcriptional regulator n=1 Tax=Sinomicrobium sp. N-1-3-6 TaxID=2219864 RepID=UPI0011BEC3C2|nr:AraC family transcriptional regulator [Sinomicrobium sp. N-1-3-6]
MNLHFLHKNLETNFKVSIHNQPEFLKLWHYHPEYELVYISRGRGTIYVGDHIGPYNPGDIFLIGSNLPHMFETTAVTGSEEDIVSESYVIHFRDSFLREFLRLPLEFGYIPTLSEAAVAGLSFPSPAPGISGSLRKLAHGSIRENTLDILRILYQLEQQEKTTLASPAWIDQFNSRDRKLNRILQYIMLHFQEDLSLEAVASYSGMNRTAFCRYFKGKTGKSFITFLNDLRISFACKALLEDIPSRSVSEVCYASGFNSLSYFHRIFKRHKGVAPSEYQGG